MNWLPNNIPSFIWGFAVAIVGMVATGFLREVGKELWGVFKKKYFPASPPPPDPIQVDLRFKPTTYAEKDCIWARHESVSRYESEGYTYYPHPYFGGKVVRGYDREASFLMVKPDAKQQSMA